MQQPEILKLKEELAEKYIEDLRKDLNFLEKGAIYLVEKKIKKLLLQEDKLPDTLGNLTLTKFEQFLVSLSPETAKNVFTILKEKQEFLLRAQTKEELEALKKGITLPPTAPIDPSTPAGTGTDHTDNSSTADKSVTEPKAEVTSNNDSDNDKNDTHSDDRVHPGHGKNPLMDIGIIGGGLAAEGGQKLLREKMYGAKAEKLAEELNEGTLKQGITDLIKTLETRMKDTELLEVQRNNIQKMIDLFKKGAHDADAIDELKAWKKLVKLGKLHAASLGNITEETVKAMEMIKENKTLINELAQAGNEAKVTEILKDANINGMNREAIGMLANAGSAEDIESIARITAKSKKLISLAKVTKAIPFLDLAYMGISTYNFVEGNKEAEEILNKEKVELMKNKNAVHYGVDRVTVGLPGAIGVMAALAPGLVAAGPAGWIALGGVAAGEGINYAMDTLYFDVQEFYATNKDEFIGQYRTEIKQAIVQAAAGAGFDNLSINEEICAMMGGVDHTRKMKTLEDALRALIYLEEKDTYGADKTSLNNAIDVRMSYLKQYLPGEEKSVMFMQKIQSAGGVAFLEKIVAESKVYAEMKLDPNTMGTTVEEYMKNRGEALQERNGELFAKLSTLKENDPIHFAEFAQKVEIFKSALSKDTGYASDYAGVEGVVDFAIDFYAWSQLGVPTEQRVHMLLNADIDYADMQKTLQQIAAGGPVEFSPTVFSAETVKERVASGWDKKRYEEIEHYSDNIGQNVIYRIAKEFHGYEGPNDMQLLEIWFTEGKDKSLGLYFNRDKQVRKINNDYAVDQTINLHDLEKKSVAEIMNSRFTDVPAWKYMTVSSLPFGAFLTPALSLVGKENKQLLDTPTETTDKMLNTEFIAQIRLIVEEEQHNLSEENKRTVATKIETYIHEHAKDGYIKLPYYLILDGARAGIGNLQYYYFNTNSDGKIHATASSEYVSKSLSLTHIVKEYIDLGETTNEKKDVDLSKATMKELSENEEDLNNAVDTMTKKIQETCGEITRHGRGNVLYEPVTHEVKSWGGAAYCAKGEDGKRHIGQTKETIYNVAYESMEEALRTANLFNRMREYRKQHSDMKLDYNRTFIGTGLALRNLNAKGGVMNRRGRSGVGYQLIDPDTLDDTFTHTFDTKEHREAFVEYVANILI